ELPVNIACSIHRSGISLPTDVLRNVVSRQIPDAEHVRLVLLATTTLQFDDHPRSAAHRLGPHAGRGTHSGAYSNHFVGLAASMVRKAIVLRQDLCCLYCPNLPHSRRCLVLSGMALLFRTGLWSVCSYVDC